VPAALAALAATNGGLDEGEREVTVLFADLRGYTTFAEGAGAAAAHALKARYAALVSGILEAHGGFLVDIAGDGVLGAFGAHQALPDKERAALRAARAILARVPGLDDDGAAARSAAPAPEAGIGVATGLAFVGTVRAADRLIFTVTGDPVNLASRLQGLTRELEAALVIDAATCRAAGDEAADLAPRSGVAIRGREAHVDVRMLGREAGRAGA
jgi:adenylate cyclase